MDAAVPISNLVELQQKGQAVTTAARGRAHFSMIEPGDVLEAVLIFYSFATTSLAP